MVGTYNFKNDIVIGLPWSVSVTLPENLSGKTVQFILRKKSLGDMLATYTNPTNITIGTTGDTTPITITLSASDTGGLTAQDATYSLRVLNSREYLIGDVKVRS